MTHFLQMFSKALATRTHLDVRGLTQKGLPMMNPFRGRSKADPGAIRVPSSGDSLMIYK